MSFVIFAFARAYWKGRIKLNEDKRVFAIISFFLAFTSILSTLPNEICLQSDKQNLAPTKRKENVHCVQFLNVTFVLTLIFWNDTVSHWLNLHLTTKEVLILFTCYSDMCSTLWNCSDTTILERKSISKIQGASSEQHSMLY